MLKKVHDLFRLRTSPVIFFISAAIITVFVVVTLIIPTEMGTFWGTGSGWLYENLGWFYVSGVTIFLIFLLWMAVGRFGLMRLGDDHERPEHSDISWFGMLFAAGIGTILMFWAVAEPANHFENPPRGEQLGIEGGSEEAAREAMGFTLYHFGLHTWTIFTLPGLAFAYFIYKRKLPPRVSSLFQPLLGDRIHGPIGKAIDVFAIVGTIFGVAVSIGLGTMQIHAGLAQLVGLPDVWWAFIVIIGVVTLVATISSVLGVERGIKRLSNFNIWTAIALLVFILATGPTVYLLRGMFEWTGVYLGLLPEVAWWNDSLADTGWQEGWTIFYWAWTIAWAPFVGIFIARISRGRTVRQFVTGVLGLPTLFTIIWFGVWGTGVFDIELNGDGGLVDSVIEEGVETALFSFLAEFPLATLTSSVAIMLVGIFFITSMDSCSLVLDDMCNGFEGKAPLHQRAFWTIAIGAIAAVLLTATGEGGLEALQNVALVFGLPFFVLGYFIMFNLSRAMREDAGEIRHLKTRRWLQTLPPEEFERRMAENDDTLANAVVAPDYAEGTQPENAPPVEHVEQPDVVTEYRIRTGENPVVDPAAPEAGEAPPRR
jgi:choline/glycine/proline betaine transport protein